MFGGRCLVFWVFGVWFGWFGLGWVGNLKVVGGNLLGSAD